MLLKLDNAETILVVLLLPFVPWALLLRDNNDMVDDDGSMRPSESLPTEVAKSEGSG